MADYGWGFQRGVANWGRTRGTRRLGYGRDYWLGRGWRTEPTTRRGMGRDIREHIYPYRDYGREYGYGRFTGEPRPGAEREFGGGYGPRTFGYGEYEYRPEREHGWRGQLRRGWRELRGQAGRRLGMGYGGEYEPRRRDRWGW